MLEEMEGRNVLVAYWYKHELSHILHSVPASRAIADKEDIEDWNAGRIRVGLVNSSMGGMRGDLSAGGNILIWYSLTWSLGLYSRTNERVCGEGQDPVIVHLISCGTIDEAVAKTLREKKKDNRLLLEAIRDGGRV